MRLAPEKIKQAILHPQQGVRNAAICFYSESLDPNPSIMPAAIDAINQYGIQEAFTNLSFLENLAQSDESISWLIDQLAQYQSPEQESPEDETARDETAADEAVGDDDTSSPIHSEAEDNGGQAFRLSMLLADTDISLLKRHRDRLLMLDELDPDAKAIISERIYLSTADPEECWKEIEDFCQRNKRSEDAPESAIDAVYRRMEVVARQRDQFSARVLEVLAAEIDEVEANPLTWMEGFAIWLAGEMRLREAAPHLVNKLQDDIEWLNEECVEAFVKLAQPRNGPQDEHDEYDAAQVLTVLCDPFFSSGWHYRVAAAMVLARTPTAAAEQKCLELLGREEEVDIRIRLCQALLLGCSVAGVEPSRQMILRRTLTPELMDLRRHLLAASDLMEIEFPERDRWRRDAELDEERRRQLFDQEFPVVDEYNELLRQNRLGQDASSYSPSFSEAASEAPPATHKSPPPTQSVMGREKPQKQQGTAVISDHLAHKRHVGRNDPCPCGSGKKYKKCCLRS